MKLSEPLAAVERPDEQREPQGAPDTGLNPNDNSLSLRIPESIPNADYQLFENYKALEIVLKHHVFNADEAAMYCRCSAESIHYHATRSRKLTFLKFSKEGLVFLKKDLDQFLENARVEGFRDHS